jgi:hypothetical protein
MKKIRPLGEILLELEELITEMVHAHGLQWGDIFGLVRSHLEIHEPAAREEYVDGGNPEFKYGPKDE